MVKKLKPYYCYVDDGKVIISPVRPDDFETLSYAKVENVPTIEIARSVYESDLTLMKMRKGEC